MQSREKDVYKRQGLYCGQDLCHTRLIICTQQRGAIGRDQGLPFHAGQKWEGGYPVSYTHLDVYKRQAVVWRETT